MGWRHITLPILSLASPPPRWTPNELNPFRNKAAEAAAEAEAAAVAAAAEAEAAEAEAAANAPNPLDQLLTLAFGPGKSAREAEETELELGAGGGAALAYVPEPPLSSDLELAGKLAAITLGGAYLVKYGELGLGFPFEVGREG